MSWTSFKGWTDGKMEGQNGRRMEGLVMPVACGGIKTQDESIGKVTKSCTGGDLL